MKKAFTLTELLIVIIVVGILAAISVPLFSKAVEHSRGQSAKSQLRLLRAAEKMYFLDYGEYIECDDTDECNDKFGLDMPEGDWDYKIEATPANVTSITAGRKGTGGWLDCVYAINLTGEPYVSAGPCP